MLKTLCYWYGFIASILMLGVLGLWKYEYIGTLGVWCMIALSYVGFQLSNWYLVYEARRVYLSKLIVR